MTSLELFTREGDTLADKMRAAVQAEGLEALVKDAKGSVRAALADAVTEESKRTGTQFTAKLDGWSAQWTDPDPTPQVTDPLAFALWCRSQGLPFEEREYIEVTDDERAAEILRYLDDVMQVPTDDPFGPIPDIHERFVIHAEFVFPEDPFKEPIDSGRCKIVGNPDDGHQLVDVETGETVPGVTVTRSKPQLRLVPKGKAQRTAARREVAELLGLPPEIGGGA